MFSHHDGDDFHLFESEDLGGYFFQSAKVSPEFRGIVRAACPFPFTGTPDADFCLRLLQYLLFPMLPSEDGTRVVVPCRTLAVLDGVGWTSNYRAGERLRFFAERTGIPLDIGPWDYLRGKARTVRPAWPAALVAARDEELARFARRRPRVYFDTGEPYGRSRRARRERIAFIEQRRRQALLLPEGHPQRPVLELLNRQSERVMRGVIKENLSAARLCVLGMPAVTDRERRSREWAMAVLDAVSLDCGMAYRAGQKTARVFATGTTLHQLPREVRKALLAGCVTLDLKAAQLALAARLWDVPMLQDRLERGNHWQMLLEELGLGAGHKPALKTATYALLFGKSFRGRGKQDELSGVVHDLALALGGDAAAWEAAKRFARLPVTRCLVDARRRRMKQVTEEGGLTTVFGVYVPVPSDAALRPGMPLFHDELRSALAQELQAYEQRLMLPALEVLTGRRGVSVVSYLHDGITLHFGDRGKERGTVAAMIREVGKEAVRQGVATALEREG